MNFRRHIFRLQIRRCCLAALASVSLATAAAAQDNASPGGFEWKTESPESHGLSAAKLESFKDALAARGTKSLLIVHRDRIVYEWYAPDHGPDKPHYTASLAKAVVGGLSTAVALSDGQLSLDDPAAKFVPQWQSDPRKSKITLRHLGSHTSGVEDAEADDLPHDQLTGWKGDFWKRLDVPHDPFTISRDLAPVVFEPGTQSAYSNPGIAMLTYATTAAIKGGPHKDVRTLLKERVLRPIGLRDQDYSVGYGKVYEVDGLPLVGSWGGGNFTARALARVGRLTLRGGNWEGRQLISEAAVRAVTSDVGTPGNCGIGWWSNNSGRYEKLPRDAYWGSGAGHQILLVIPSLELIAVRNGASLGPAYEDAVGVHLFDPLMAAIAADQK